MSENKFDIDDMALEDNEQSEKLDMDLESLSPVEIAARIKESFPDANIIKVNDKTDLVKMASGSYSLGDTALKDCTPDELNEIDNFLKSKED